MEVQLVQVDGVPAQDPRKELVPGDVLFSKEVGTMLSSSLMLKHFKSFSLPGNRKYQRSSPLLVGG